MTAEILAPGRGRHDQLFQLTIFTTISHGQIIAHRGHAEYLRAFDGKDDFASFLTQQLLK